MFGRKTGPLDAVPETPRNPFEGPKAGYLGLARPGDPMNPWNPSLWFPCLRARARGEFETRVSLRSAMSPAVGLIGSAAGIPGQAANERG